MLVRSSAFQINADEDMTKQDVALLSHIRCVPVAVVPPVADADVVVFSVDGKDEKAGSKKLCISDSLF